MFSVFVFRRLLVDRSWVLNRHFVDEKAEIVLCALI